MRKALFMVLALFATLFLIGCSKGGERQLDPAEQMLSETKFQFPVIENHAGIPESALPEYLGFFNDLQFELVTVIPEYVTYADGRDGFRIVYGVNTHRGNVDYYYRQLLANNTFWKQKDFDNSNVNSSVDATLFESVGEKMPGTVQFEMVLASNWCGENYTCVVVQTVSTKY